MPAPKTPLNCVRCRQPLPEGSYYCVACGCNNESALQDRMVDIGNQLESRRWWFQFWNSLANVFPWIRWLR